MRRIGAIFPPEFPPERLRAVVEAAEAGGVPELWLWEDCFQESAFASAAAALAWSDACAWASASHRCRCATSRSRPWRSRLSRACSRRLHARRRARRAALDGAGREQGRLTAHAHARVRAGVAAAARRRRGDHDGRFVQLDRVRLAWPPAVVPPVYAAGEGPKTLHLTGEVADGTVLTGGTTVERAAEAVAAIAAGRAAAGRDGRNEVVVYLLTAFGGAEAEARMARELTIWNMPDDQRLAAVGDAGAVAEAAERFFAVGVDAVVLQPTSDEPDLTGFMRQVGEVARQVSS